MTAQTQQIIMGLVMWVLVFGVFYLLLIRPQKKKDKQLKEMRESLNVGDKVTKGQTVAVIEAMKLENEVPSTVEGVVKEIKVSNGSSVNNGDVLIVLG